MAHRVAVEWIVTAFFCVVVAPFALSEWETQRLQKNRPVTRQVCPPSCISCFQQVHIVSLSFLTPLMSLNDSLIPAAKKVRDALSQAKSFLAEAQPWDALKVVTELERDIGIRTIEEWHASGTALVPIAVVVSWCYCRGVCLGMLERHDEALQCGVDTARLFREYPEGCYLAGMATAAQKDFERARSFFDDARKRDEGRRGVEESKKTSKLIASRIRTLQHNQTRKLIQRHALLVQSISPAPCSKCNFQSTLPTPRWVCPRCYTQDGVQVAIWQSDAAGVCHACNTSLATGSRHHCRSCGKLCCASCSNHNTLVSILGYHDDPVRICSPCYHRVTATQNEAIIRGHAGAEPRAARLGADDSGDEVDDDNKSTRSSAYSVCSAIHDGDDDAR